MRTTILFGPPGTGKTTALLNEVDEALRAGVEPNKIAFFAFTRKAAREAIHRAASRFSMQEDDLPWFRTLHSAAFKIIGLSSSDVMQQDDYTNIGVALGRFTFAHSYSEETERVPLGGALGDRALGIYTRARSRCISVEQEWHEYPDNFEFAELTLPAVQQFVNTLEAYKAERHLLDFSDFLDEAHEELDLELLIIDEAQDLTRQQWNFVRRIGRRAKRVIIAGDDDQAIFQWAGADLDQFLRIRANMKVLPISYRLPKNVWLEARRIVNKIRGGFHKEWTHREGDAGRMISVPYLDSVDMLDGNTWLLLTRMKHQLDQVEMSCREKGVVYQKDGIWSNDTREIRAVVLYEKLRRGDAIAAQRAEIIRSFIPGMQEIMHKGQVTWDEIKWPFDGRPNWMQTIEPNMGQWHVQYIKELRRTGQSLTQPGNIVLSTIHGQKGGEADNVVLYPGISRRIQDSMRVDEDAEHRVWYVGVSRAIHNLYLVEPNGRRNYEF